MSKGRMIPRGQFEAAILRAAMLASTEADTEDRISEDELLRIGAELGLPARHVRRALFELPAADADSDRGLLQRILGPANIVGWRVVAGEPESIQTRLEDYLGTREYLRLARRQGDLTWFEPAEDTISHVVRALRRPASRFHVSRARRVGLAVRTLEPGHVHVRLDLDQADKRRGAATAGGVLGGLCGALAASGGLLALGGFTEVALASSVGILSTVAALSGLGAGAGIGLGALRFRRRTTDAREELDSLLDRLERDEDLDPPPAPWRKRIRRGLALPDSSAR